MKKEAKISFSVIMLFFAIIIIAVMGYVIYDFYNEKTAENKKVIELQSQLNNLNGTVNELQNMVNSKNEEKFVTNVEDIKKDNNKKEVISINSKDGKNIEKYLKYVWIEEYKDCMAEFQDIKSAPIDYLGYCASVSLMREYNGDEIFNANKKFSDFNDMVVKLFGENANGLLQEKDLDKVFFVEKNNNGTYNFEGYGYSEQTGSIYNIKSIEKENNIFYVDLYEYKYEYGKVLAELENGESTFEKIYDKNNNLILNLNIKNIENITPYQEYYEDKIINSLYDFLLENYKDKLSVRNITLEYNENSDSFIMLNNKLENNSNAKLEEKDYNDIILDGSYTILNSEGTFDFTKDGRVACSGVYVVSLGTYKTIEKNKIEIHYTKLKLEDMDTGEVEERDKDSYDIITIDENDNIYLESKNGELVKLVRVGDTNLDYFK